MELAETSIKRQKHLGQYFSGPLVASLLAYLAKHYEAKSIIDPMCGTGDMLKACNPTSNPYKNFVGVEIDSSVSEYAQSRFASASNVHITNSSAFDKDILKGIMSSEFDLVITNPPYVRYQTIAESKSLNEESQSTSEIKQNLLSALLCHSNLPPREKDVFKRIISNYSGLADLAVPSWILCALLVKQGGRIAMVVPQTWLNRDYSEAIHYLLVKLFQIEFIIEDANSVWFPDAQVKTTLLIAKRIEIKESILDWTNESFSFCRIFSSAISRNSLVGKIFPDSSNPEKEFYNALESNQSKEGIYSNQKILINHFSTDAGKRLQNSKWFNLLEPNIDRRTLKTAHLKPSSLLFKWLEGATPDFSCLQELGINVSQGLRTGANSFFYFKLCSESPEGVEAMPSKYFFQSPITIPSGSYRKVITKQSEVSEQYSTAYLKPLSVVLYLQEAVIKGDFENNLKKDIDLRKWYTVLPVQLSAHVENAQSINVGTIEKPKRYPHLSAVSPNIRQWNPLKPNTPPRFWYMLPKFTDRHLPDLFIPRVNNLHPQTRLNLRQEFVIDANFSSLWLGENNNRHTLHSLLAVLNSSWAHIAMEEFGTAMGGGALKLEATQLKKLPIPRFTAIEIDKLDRLGRRLALSHESHEKVLSELDKFIVSKMGFEANLTTKLNELNSIKQTLLNYRQS
ncbi:N-6 DNA methylase [Halocola ammonii]